MGGGGTPGILAAMADTRPIGVFDSGVGGLTVMRQLSHEMPAERLIYVADLLHFPYGPRPITEVRDFALALVEYLAARDCKLVVIACNTATAAALNRAREVFDIPVVGVIAPGAEAAVQATRNGQVAVISTQGTHDSQEYVHAIREVNPGVSVRSHPVPELVDLVEAGEADGARADALLTREVTPLLEWGADTLVLGCTHYPLLQPAIRRVFGEQLHVVDSAGTTAAKVRRIAATLRLEGKGSGGHPELLVTAEPVHFTDVARRIFGADIPEPQLGGPWTQPAVSR